ncbi:Sodium/potassium-transporting ATPase subunit beta-2 [Nibea albiflora]|uniref:Sodium/potassium-transporting ATPase subunit beta-2 n=1 Tax=Nibea albiflora TaxID=240163 RepID=A0ACB7EVA5_NIBAL|nr:Sodium/potassium-transporting ATPase subunit beta-2 [Nibea albiflora]
MFVLTMYIMLLTLDDYKPTWQDRLATPGMMIRPKGDQLEISFSVSDTESWDGFIQNLNTFLSLYNDSYQVQTNDNCPPDQYFIQEDSGEVRNNPKRSCQFNRTMLGDCSGIVDRFYGYNRGQPCILIKLNRVNYTQPLVAVKFLNASLNTDINVECKINSNTLADGSERDKFAGRVSFKLRINDK